MSSCIIQLDNFQGQYYSGGNIVGRVICSFKDSKDIREIRVKLRGKEHTNWTGTESYYDSERKETMTRSVEYYGDNKFLELETSVRGSGHIGPGRFEYPFEFTLPKNLPGSYNGKCGWIRYSLKATVDRPLKSDYEDMKEFTVVAPIDFNEIKDQLQLSPVVYSDDKTLCCFCCASGPITMNVHLDKEAYVQGETAKVKVDISNLANESIERVDVKLQTMIKSKVTFPSSESKYDYELLATATDTGVGAHGDRIYNFNLEIPRSTVVPNFNLCTLFKQSTKLTVKAILPSFHENMSISTNIVIGHIPIEGQFQNISMQQSVFYPPQQNNQFPPAGILYPPAVSPYPPSDTYKPPYPLGNVSTSFYAVHQTPYPPSVQPFPPSSQLPSYPDNSNLAPYPPNSNPTPYPPVAPPPTSGDIGFAVPQPATNPATEFPNLPSGALPPMPQHDSPPYPKAMGSSDQSGPTAPPIAPAPIAPAPIAPAPIASAPIASAPIASAPIASALSKDSLASDYVMVDANSDGEDEYLLPPSYKDAVVPPYPPK